MVNYQAAQESREVPLAGFDPFAWFEQYVPAGWLHRGIRLAGAVLCGGFVLLRVRQYDAFALKPLWVVENAVFVVLAWAFCSRLDPVDRSRGAREILVPLVGGLLPFGLLFSPPNSVMGRADTWTETCSSFM